MRKIMLSTIVSGALLFGLTACDDQPSKEASASTEVTAEDASETTAANKTALQVSDTDMVMGNPDAPVTIIEYASLSCPHCADFHSKVFPELKKEYIDTGKVRFVFRHFPFNEPALRASQLVSCAPDEQKFAFLKVLFQAQKSWAFTEDFKEGLRRTAALGGMNGEAFDACMGNLDVENALIKVKQTAANELEIQSTPSFFVNNVKISGTQPIESFRKAMEPVFGKADESEQNNHETTAGDNME